MLVAESAEGQLGRLVRLALADQVLTSFRSYYRPGLGITSEEILERPVMSELSMPRCYNQKANPTASVPVVVTAWS